MTHPEQEPQERPLWDVGEQLCELEMSGSSASTIYTVRLKAHVTNAPYKAEKELYPLRYRGTRVEILGKAYVLVPALSLTVGLVPPPDVPTAVGRVTDTAWEGMEHQDIARARGLYYEQDKALALWEVDDFDRLGDAARGQLWQAFECWLILRYPEATHIFTDDDEPGDNTQENQ